MIDHARVDEIRRALVEEARGDVVGLWAVLWQVRHGMPLLTAEEAKRTTLAIVHEALEEGVVAGGFVRRDEHTAEFVPWRSLPDEAVARIEREWNALGRDPRLGEVAWFVDPGILPVTARIPPV